jgi:hypothetical protein
MSTRVFFSTAGSHSRLDSGRPRVNFVEVLWQFREGSRYVLLSSSFVPSVLLILAFDHFLSCSYWSNLYLYIDELYWLMLATLVLSVTLASSLTGDRDKNVKLKLAVLLHARELGFTWCKSLVDVGHNSQTARCARPNWSNMISTWLKL